MAETLRKALLATAGAPKAPPPSVEQKKRKRDRSAKISPILDHLADDELLLTRAETAGYLRTSVPTMERTICQQNAVAVMSKRRTPSPRSCQLDSRTRRTVVEPGGPLRQNVAKSCSPRNGSAPRRSNARSRGWGTHHAVRARNGSGSGRLTIV